MKIILYITLCMLCSCKAKKEQSLESYVTTRLNVDSSALNLDGFKPFPWNRMYVIGPYATENDFDQSLRVNKEDILKTGIGIRDDIAIVVLFNGPKLMQVAVFPRNIDFSTAVLNKDGQLSFYNRSQAKFKIEQRNSDQKIVYPLKK